MAVFSATPSATCINGNLNHNNNNFLSSKHFSDFISPARSRTSTIVNMAPKKKVNKIDGGWKKQWFRSQDILRRVGRHRSGRVQEAREAQVAGYSPAALASAALPVLVAALAVIVLIPDDSAALVVVQYVVAAVLGAGAVGLLVGSVVLDGLQEAD
ncbi:hypothetical protein J5N97_000244 [Dioscorea zingiberensis]|uniref:Uncharacterized protein n=1 Tax=Dioscorea zingiberensis TaxID=325984 RepID=A0A9D5H1L2_9LILI|nr:hypothetical protein J5N97_000244 [Dioscorea zingiberensis]